MKTSRVIIFFIVLLTAAFLALAARCVYLQILKRDYYTNLSLIQQRKLVQQQPQRGSILDCRGGVLAASKKANVIFAEPRVIKEPKEFACQLQPILGMGADEICRLIAESKNPGYAKLKIADTINECVLAQKIHGIGIETQWQRAYPMGTAAAHIVGFISNDNRGLGGIELQCDKQLAGSPGLDIFLADTQRRPLQLMEQPKTLVDGTSIILTIDSTIQGFAHEELLNQFKTYQAEAAIAIVADPKTGAILAFVSLPEFDPNNLTQQDIDKHLLNHALTDQFEPGSVFKPFAAAVALDAGAIGYDEVIFCENGFYHGKGFGSISEYDNHRYGNMTIKEILAKSSNIGMAKVGQKLGKEKLYKGLKLFGFGDKTGIDLPGETTGLLRPPSAWTGYSITRIPFGQEVTVNAIQILKAFCILANGGHVVNPYLVKALISNDGQITKLRHAAPPVGFAVNPKVANWLVTVALTSVVNDGTGKPAKLEKWQVFGKTGTANIARSNMKGYSEEDYVASFIGGAPAEDPQVVALVVVRKPNKRLGKGYTGGAVSSPVVGRIIEKTLTYLESQKK